MLHTDLLGGFGEKGFYIFDFQTNMIAKPRYLSTHPLGTYSAERWCCLSSLIGYWAQSSMGHHSDTGYQQAGTHFSDLRRMTGSVNPTWY